MSVNDVVLNTNMSSKERYFLFLFCVCFCLQGSYFTWETFGGVISKAGSSIVFNFVVGLFLLITYTNRGYSLNISRSLFFSMLFLGLFCLHMLIFTGDGIVLDKFFFCGKVFLFVVALMICDVKRKIFIFNTLAKVFALAILPSILVFVLYNFGIELPFTILETDHWLKGQAGMFYRMYPLGLMLTNDVGTLMRPCGIWDEAGVIGTFIPFLIAGGFKTLGKKWLGLMAFEGMCSTSAAFFALMVCFSFVYLMTVDYRKAMGLIISLLLGMFVFVNIEVTNPSLQRMQSRLDFSTATVLKDNRTSPEFDIEYSKFVDAGGYGLFMGNGEKWFMENMTKIDACSWKIIVYMYGIVGLLLYGMFFSFMTKYLGVTKYSLPFLCTYVISLYQRPYIVSLQFLLIFITAMTTLNQVYRKVKNKNASTVCRF